MKTFIVLVLGVVTAGLAAPNPDDFALLVQPRRELDLIADARNLIQNLASDLRKSAQDAMSAVGNFTEGIRDEASKIREKINDDIQNLRARVQDAIDNVWNRIGNATAGARQCVDSRREVASNLFNETVSRALGCVDERVSDIGSQVNGLSDHATAGLNYANSALEDMRRCTEENHNLFTVGGCLAGTAFQVETKSVMYGAQMATMIGRINLSIATLPASLEMCAGSQLVQAGMVTGRIVLEMGGCAVSSVYNGFIGNTNQTPTTTTIAPTDTAVTEFPATFENV